MTYFYNNSYNPFAFIGQIISYAGGSTDPSGWVIADGVQRTNTNGIYTNLANLGIGTLINGNADYTPPNLSGYLLCGSDDTYPILSFNGVTNNEIILTKEQLPSHTHGTITTNSGGGTHTHTYYDYYFSDNSNITSTTKSAGGDGHGSRYNTRTTGYPTYTNHTVTIGSAGQSLPTALNIANRSYVIYWIIKY
jgi:microcystin-dependent protein